MLQDAWERGVDLCSLTVRGLPNPCFEHVWCGLSLLEISLKNVAIYINIRPSQSPIFLPLEFPVASGLQKSKVPLLNCYTIIQWDSSYSRPSPKLAKQLGMPCATRDNTESLTIQLIQLLFSTRGSFRW